jgi:hypothetical protein
VTAYSLRDFSQDSAYLAHRADGSITYGCFDNDNVLLEISQERVVLDSATLTQLPDVGGLSLDQGLDDQQQLLAHSALPIVDDFPDDFLDHLSLTITEADDGKHGPSCTQPVDPLPLDVGPSTLHPVSNIWHLDVESLRWKNYNNALEAELSSIRQECMRPMDVWSGGRHGNVVVLEACYTWNLKIEKYGHNKKYYRVIKMEIPPICTYVRGQALLNTEDEWKKNTR